MSEVKDKMSEVFREVFNNDDIKLFDEMTPDHVEEWDSLSHINLIFTLEQVFNIRFTTEEIGTVQSVGELTKAIEEKLSATEFPANSESETQLK